MYNFEHNCKVIFPTREEWIWAPHLPSVVKGLVWYTDRSRNDRSTVAGIYGPNLKLTFPLGKITTVFQAEVFAVLTCVHNIQNKPGLKRQVYICSDIQAALKALCAVKVTSTLISL
jgi:hypothetical protein